MSTYCTIEEAWGEDFTRPKKNKSKKKKVSLNSDEYRAKLPGKRRKKLNNLMNHTNIYDSNNYHLNSNINSNNNKYCDNTNFSRGMNLLPEHGGPKKRTTMLENIHGIKNSVGDYMGYHPQDLYQYEEVSNLQNDIYECPQKDEILQTESEEDDDDDNDKILVNKHSQKLSQNNKSQNKINTYSQENFENLSAQVDNHLLNNQFMNNNTTLVNTTLNSRSDNIYDLILYIFTGVFYLVVMDFIYKLGKRSY